MFTNDERPKTLQECFERLKKACEWLIDEEVFSTSGFKFNPPVTEEKLKEFESHLKFPLPHGYREFLKFSNGAKIMENCATIYGLDWFAVSDPMVPDGYLTIGEVVGDGKRIAISEEDGQVYSCYNGQIELWDFEDEIAEILRRCEEKVQEIENENARAERRKAGITVEQEMYDIYVRLLGEERTKEIFEEIKRSKAGDINE